MKLSLFRTFSRRRAAPEDWTVLAGESELYRLTFLEHEPGFFWMKYAVTLIHGDLAAWAAATDPARSPREFACTMRGSRSGIMIPFEGFMLAADARDPAHVRVKWVSRG